MPVLQSLYCFVVTRPEASDLQLTEKTHKINVQRVILLTIKRNIRGITCNRTNILDTGIYHTATFSINVAVEYVYHDDPTLATVVVMYADRVNDHRIHQCGHGRSRDE